MGARTLTLAANGLAGSRRLNAPDLFAGELR
jgi:hypothetical protein